MICRPSGPSPTFGYNSELIEKVAEKMKEYENDGLGYGIFEKIDKELNLARGTAWDASGYKDYADFVVFNDV